MHIHKFDVIRSDINAALRYKTVSCINLHIRILLLLKDIHQVPRSLKITSKLKLSRAFETSTFSFKLSEEEYFEKLPLTFTDSIRIRNFIRQTHLELGISERRQEPCRTTVCVQSAIVF